MKPASAALLIVFLLAALPSAARADSTAATLESLQKEVARLQQENASLKAELSELRQQLNISEQTTVDLKEEKKQLQVLAGLPDQAAVPHARLSSAFDASLGVTRVTAKPLTIPQSTKLLDVVHAFGASYQFKGESPSDPVTDAQFVITTIANTKKSYKSLKSIQLIAGGQSFTLSVDGYAILDAVRSNGRQKITRYDEEIRVRVPYAQLRQISRLTPLELKIGRRDFALTHDHEALIDAVAERMRETGAAN